MNEFASLGMTDRELEAACVRSPFEIRHYYSYTTEIYSFGKCWRALTGYPRVLPLFVYSDHGAGLHSTLYPHEFNNPSRVHLTWHPTKAERNLSSGRWILRTEHPWVFYRKKRGFRRAEKTAGTLVFFTHNVPGVVWEHDGESAYFDQLRSLPEEFHPIVLCLHMHDIKSGLYKSLRKYGFPIVTVGNIHSTDFVDRFYALVSNFSFATSPDWGSQVAYCVEFGLPYFFLGPVPQLINHSHREMPLGAVTRYQDEDHRAFLDAAHKIFAYPDTHITPEKVDFVSTILGVGAGLPAYAMRRIFWREFFKGWRHWYLIPRAWLMVVLRLAFFGRLEAVYRLSLNVLRFRGGRA